MSEINSIYGNYITKVEDIHVSLPNDNRLRTIIIIHNNHQIITHIQHIPGNNYSQGNVKQLINYTIPGQYTVYIYDERYPVIPEAYKTFTLPTYDEQHAVIGLLNIH